MSRPAFLDRSLAGASAGESVRVPGAVSRHMAVIRIRPGEEFDLVDGAGLRMRAVLDEGPDGRHDDGATVVRVVGVSHEAPARPELVLVQALAKGSRDDQAVEAVTEIGVDRVIPWQAARSIAQWPRHKEEKASAKWRALLDSATQQSRRARAPELEPLARGGEITARLAEGDHVLVLHEDAAVHLVDLLGADAEALAGRTRIVVVVGPEGGIAPEEIEAFDALGAHAVLLGPTVLRTSSAGPSGLALIQAALGRWSA